jgi:hypothetical protein
VLSRSVPSLFLVNIAAAERLYLQTDGGKLRESGMPHAALALLEATAYVADLIGYRHTTDWIDVALIAETTEAAAELASSARDFTPIGWPLRTAQLSSTPETARLVASSIVARAVRRRFGSRTRPAPAPRIPRHLSRLLIPVNSLPPLRC